MGGPKPGRYHIQLDTGRRPLIGVNPGGGPIKPVVTDGMENIWIVEKVEDDKYTLTLATGGGPVYIQDDEGNLVGSKFPPPTLWAIQGEDNGPYTIEVPSIIFPTRGWTVNKPEPEKPVTLSIIMIPLPNQKWNFLYVGNSDD